MGLGTGLGTPFVLAIATTVFSLMSSHRIFGEYEGGVLASDGVAIAAKAAPAHGFYHEASARSEVSEASTPNNSTKLVASTSNSDDVRNGLAQESG